MEIIHSIIDFLLHIDKHLVEIVRDYKTWTYLILFFIIFAETGFVVTPFLPGDSLLFAAGALIAKGDTGLNIYLMAVLLCIAAILGNTVNYFLGDYFGAKVFKPENKILKLDYYLKTKEFFNKHGGKAVIFSRYMPIIRTIAPFVAGVGKMPFGTYMFYNIVGGLSWIIIFVFFGFLFGNIPLIKNNFSIVVLVITILSVAPMIYAALLPKFKRAKVKA